MCIRDRFKETCVRGHQRAVSHKSRYFTVVGKSTVKKKRLQICMDMLPITTSPMTSFLVVSTSMTLKDPELQNKGFHCCFFAIFGCAAQFKSELRRNGWRWTTAICTQELLCLVSISSNFLLLPLPLLIVMSLGQS